jgi:hypothetical protein
LLCRFGTTNNKFPIETGRWQNFPRENRKCKLCNRSQNTFQIIYIVKKFCFPYIWEATLIKYLFYKQYPTKLHTSIMIYLKWSLWWLTSNDLWDDFSELTFVTTYLKWPLWWLTSNDLCNDLPQMLQKKTSD